MPRRSSEASADPSLDAPYITGGRPLAVEESLAPPAGSIDAEQHPEPGTTAAADEANSTLQPSSPQEQFVDPAIPFRRRTFPAVGDTPSSPEEALSHPLATPATALERAGTLAPATEPPAPDMPARDMPALGVTSDPPFPPDSVPWSRPEDLLPGTPAALDMPPSPIEDDPFAVAAARAAQVDPFGMAPPALPRAETPPPVFIPAHEDEPTQRTETTQDALAPARRWRTGLALAGILSVAAIAAGAGGALIWKLQVGEHGSTVTGANRVPDAREDQVPAPPSVAHAAPVAVPASSAGIRTPAAAAPAAPAAAAGRTSPQMPAATAARAAPAAGFSAEPATPPTPSGSSEPPRPIPAASTEPVKVPAHLAGAPARSEGSPNATMGVPERSREPEKKQPERPAAGEPKRTEPEDATGTPSSSASRLKSPPRSAPPLPAAPSAPVPPQREAPPARKGEAEGLDSAVLKSVIARNRSALDACVEAALEDPATASYVGRKVALLILVAPSGKAEAALEDGDIDASPLGACLRRAAAKMSFPQFRGDAVGARIVLELGHKDE